MNFFEFHIGDYAEATSHLSLIEHGAYIQLIKKYYATEKSLPRKIALVCKHAGAKNRHERNTVKKILDEFFELREDGWHNKRCDEVIAKYIAGEPDRQARKANEELRLKRFREERARLFEDLKNAGQYVAWNISMPELRKLHADLQRVNNAPATHLQRVAGVAVPVTCNAPATATQFPLPTPQFPVPSSKDTQSGFHNEVIAAYHELLPGLPAVKRWTDKRRGMLEARIRESCKLGKSADAIEYWRTFFEQVAGSDFLCGRQTKWRADLEWLIKSENFVKVIENRYENRRPTNGGAHAHG